MYCAGVVPDAGNKNGHILGQIARTAMHNSWPPPKADIRARKSGGGGAKVASQNINFLGDGCALLLLFCSNRAQTCRCDLLLFYRDA